MFCAGKREVGMVGISWGVWARVGNKEKRDSRRGRLGYLIESPKIQIPKMRTLNDLPGDTTRSTIPSTDTITKTQKHTTKFRQRRSAFHSDSTPTTLRAHKVVLSMFTRDTRGKEGWGEETHVIPGFLGTPAGMTTTSAPAKAEARLYRFRCRQTDVKSRKRV